jgi:hypothetical protein
MKKFTFITLGFLTTSLLSQPVILTENFNSYNGKDSTTPEGWTISFHGIYSSLSYSGPSGPNSYQFGKDSANLTSPVFSEADSLSFWLRGTSTISPLNQLIILQSENGNDWDTLAGIDSLPKSGKIFQYPLSRKITRLRFIYRKTTGNLAFDDFILKQNLSTGLSGNNPYIQGPLFYPNPSQGMISFEWKYKSDFWRIEIYNSTGEYLGAQEFINVEKGFLDLSAFTPGAYFVRIHSGVETYSAVLIRQR